MKAPSHIGTRGFTLVEMLVALLIFAMLSAAALVLLRSAVDANGAAARKLGEVAGNERFLSLVEGDLAQAVARTPRNDVGTVTAALTGARANDPNGFLLFTRTGNSNVNDRPRSNLQRVGYRLEDGRIIRVHQAMTDGGTLADPAPLIDGISNLQLRFRDSGGIWVDSWPKDRIAELPRAVELRFTRDGEQYRQLFLVGTGYL
ncbi:MAG: type II secretion system minor pseudopilin GspJ [Parasphingorhabdus sp.]|nr:type II secretion system minor pseudopilin GspJ [Parasphingorhabdus sp.]